MAFLQHPIYILNKIESFITVQTTGKTCITNKFLD